MRPYRRAAACQVHAASVELSHFALAARKPLNEPGSEIIEIYIYHVVYDSAAIQLVRCCGVPPVT